MLNRFHKYEYGCSLSVLSAFIRHPFVSQCHNFSIPPFGCWQNLWRAPKGSGKKKGDFCLFLLVLVSVLLSASRDSLSFGCGTFFSTKNIHQKCLQKVSTKKCPQKVFIKSVHKKCLQKVFTKSVHKKCLQKVSTKRGRGAEGERNGSGRWAAGEHPSLEGPCSPIVG